MLEGPKATVEWDGEIVAAPFWANTQLLWYRKSVAEEAGIDPENDDVTWDQILQAAQDTDTTVDVTGNRYEGYMVLINALVMSAGGEVLEDPDAGKDTTPELDSDAGRAGAEIIHTLTTTVADPSLSTAIEEDARAAFQADSPRSPRSCRRRPRSTGRGPGSACGGSRCPTFQRKIVAGLTSGAVKG